MAELISFGAGVNSVAMTILLVGEGWRGPIVFADTGAEWPETMCYLDYFEREWLKPRGLEVTRLGAEWRETKRERSMRGLVEYCEDRLIVPLAAVRWCTAEFKVKPIERWSKEHEMPTNLIGIASDERHRQKGRACPLIDRGISRKGCIEIIAAEGLDVPQKSGCYICPFQRVSQWRELWRRHPELFERAARLEELCDEAGRKNAGSRTTLDVNGKVTRRELEVAFTNQTSVFDAADWDGLLEYKPCVCGV